MPDKQKPMSDLEHLRQLDSRSLRDYLKDGNYGGYYQRQDEEMMKIWRAGVEETRRIVNRSLVDNATLQPLVIPSEYARPARTEESLNSRSRLAPLTHPVGDELLCWFQGQAGIAQE